MAQLSDSNIQFYQFLPMYDVIHLGNVLRQGYAPTSGEMTWALVDGCFVVADVLSLASVQPEGVVAAEAIRSEVKGSVRQGVGTAARMLAEAGGESTSEALLRRGAGSISERLARWWTVRSAGGIYRVLRRLPEALPQLSLGEITQMAGPLCTKAGIRLTAWRPVRFLRDGAEVAGPNPTATRLEIPLGANDPGQRWRGRIPEDGGASIVQTAASSQELTTYNLHEFHDSSLHFAAFPRIISKNAASPDAYASAPVA